MTATFTAALPLAAMLPATVELALIRLGSLTSGVDEIADAGRRATVRIDLATAASS
jgi:hypothetical protein